VPESFLVNEVIPHLRPVWVFGHYCALLYLLHVE
jgi:hypothetical protein